MVGRAQTKGLHRYETETFIHLTCLKLAASIFGSQWCILCSLKFGGVVKFVFFFFYFVFSERVTETRRKVKNRKILSAHVYGYFKHSYIRF